LATRSSDFRDRDVDHGCGRCQGNGRARETLASIAKSYTVDISMISRLS
jgi:hypothetical protein